MDSFMNWLHDGNIRNLNKTVINIFLFDFYTPPL